MPRGSRAVIKRHKAGHLEHDTPPAAPPERNTPPERDTLPSLSFKKREAPSFEAVSAPPERDSPPSAAQRVTTEAVPGKAKSSEVQEVLYVVCVCVCVSLSLSLSLHIQIYTDVRSAQNTENDTSMTLTKPLSY
jgi:hypothetical protein